MSDLPRIARIRNPLPSGFSTLVHEFSHGLHDIHDGLLSRYWVDRFLGNLDPKTSPKDKEEAKKNGAINPYALFNHNRHSYGVPTTPFRDPVAHVMEGEIKIIACDKTISLHTGEVMTDEIALRRVAAQVRNLPGNLGEAIDVVIIDQEMNFLGRYFGSSPVSTEYNVCCEDIATHAGGFTAALNDPIGNYATIEMLATHPQTSARLDTLIDFGFLDHSFREHMRESLIFHSTIYEPALQVPFAYIDAIGRGRVVPMDNSSGY